MKGEECDERIEDRAAQHCVVMLIISSALMVYFSVLHIKEKPEHNLWTYPLVMGVLLVLVASVAALVQKIQT